MCECSKGQSSKGGRDAATVHSPRKSPGISGGKRRAAAVQHVKPHTGLQLGSHLCLTGEPKPSSELKESLWEPKDKRSQLTGAAAPAAAAASSRSSSRRRRPLPRPRAAPRRLSCRGDSCTPGLSRLCWRGVTWREAPGDSEAAAPRLDKLPSRGVRVPLGPAPIVIRRLCCARLLLEPEEATVGAASLSPAAAAAAAAAAAIAAADMPQSLGLLPASVAAGAPPAASVGCHKWSDTVLLHRSEPRTWALESTAARSWLLCWRSCSCCCSCAVLPLWYATGVPACCPSGTPAAFACSRASSGLLSCCATDAAADSAAAGATSCHNGRGRQAEGDGSKLAAPLNGCCCCCCVAADAARERRLRLLSAAAAVRAVPIPVPPRGVMGRELAADAGLNQLPGPDRCCWRGELGRETAASSPALAVPSSMNPLMLSTSAGQGRAGRGREEAWISTGRTAQGPSALAGNANGQMPLPPLERWWAGGGRGGWRGCCGCRA